MIEVVDRAKRKVGNDRTLLPALEFRLDQIQAERTRLMGLYQRELIDDGDIKRVKFLNEQRTLIQDEIERAKTTRGIVNVFNASLIKSVRNVGQAVRTIDPKIRKRVVQTLFE